jgi:hypothetical protein
MTVSTVYDPIMDALLAYLEANIVPNTFLSFARGIIMWEQLATQQNSSPIIRQPALYLFDGVGFGQGTTKYEQRGRGRPVVRVIGRTIVIYAQQPSAGGRPGGTVGGPNVATKGEGTVFHPLIEAVEAVFATPDSEGALTLGGLVSHCWIEGDGILVSGDIDPQGQGMATLPVKIMVP